MDEKTVRDALREAAERLRGLEPARRDAELLLMRVVGRDRAWLLTHGDTQLTSAQIDTFESWIARRALQEPVQYIVGEQEFYGLSFRVGPAVLIPRPETEHLVEAALERVSPDAAARICDVGTGSGAIAVALAHARPRAQVTALDVSQAALEVAWENARRHGGRIRFLQSALLEAVRGERFEVVVSNPPYIADSEVLETQVRAFEPQGALFAGPTGLEVYERLIPQAREALVAGGWLLLEIGHGQRAALAELLSPRQATGGPGGGPGAEWDEVGFVEDLAGIPRVAMARRRG